MRILLFCLFLCGSVLALAAERVALVIGNANYQVGRLSNPGNDASDIAAALGKLGFAVDLKLNLDKEGMLLATEGFQSRVMPGSLAVFFYAGHAVEMGGRNFLLPIDNAAINTQAKLVGRAIATDYVLGLLEERGASLNVVILDACRDNPLPAGARSTKRGLVSVETGSSTLLAYATSPNKTADDGTGRNSPYSAVLVQALQASEVKIPDVFNQVGVAVQQKTSGAQVPWMSNTPIYPSIALAGGGVAIQQLSESASAPGALQILVTPVDAEVYVDGAFVGTGVQSLSELPANSQRVVSARKPGYLEQELKVFIKSGQATRVSLQLSSSAIAAGTGASSALQPGSEFRDRFKDGSEGPVMVVIPGGAFTMGTPAGEARQYNDTRAPKRLQMRSFALGKYEVTRGEFAKFVAANPRFRTDAEKNGCWVWQGSKWKIDNSYSWRDPGFKPYGDDHPVVCVSWNDAQAYVKWLNGQGEETRATYRLPSEAEHEYAIQAGSNAVFPWGAAWSGGCAYVNGHKFDTECSTDFYEYTAPVGSLQPNSFGLHDTLGNVSEWSQDCRECATNVHVYRGGDWGYKSFYPSSKFVVFSDAVDCSANLGFRLAQDR